MLKIKYIKIFIALSAILNLNISNNITATQTSAEQKLNVATKLKIATGFFNKYNKLKVATKFFENCNKLNYYYTKAKNNNLKKNTTIYNKYLKNNKTIYSIGALALGTSAFAIYKIYSNLKKNKSKNTVVKKAKQNLKNKDFDENFKIFIETLSDQQWASPDLYQYIIAILQKDFSAAENPNFISQLNDHQKILLQDIISKYKF